MTPKYRADDRATLRRAVDLDRAFGAGIFPSGGGSHAHFKKLERLGFLVFDDWGRDIDGEVERDVMVYRLTDAGRAAAETDGSMAFVATKDKR